VAAQGFSRAQPFQNRLRYRG